MSSDELAWDDERAQAMVGRTVLVGITRSSARGDRHQQMFGRIVSVRAAGVEISLQGRSAGKTFSLPPDFEAFQPASPGDYRLKSTREVVSNPDYLATWTVSRPAG